MESCDDPFSLSNEDKNCISRTSYFAFLFLLPFSLPSRLAYYDFRELKRAWQRQHRERPLRKGLIKETMFLRVRFTYWYFFSFFTFVFKTYDMKFHGERVHDSEFHFLSQLNRGSLHFVSWKIRSHSISWTSWNNREEVQVTQIYVFSYFCYGRRLYSLAS